MCSFNILSFKIHNNIDYFHLAAHGLYCAKGHKGKMEGTFSFKINKVVDIIL